MASKTSKTSKSAAKKPSMPKPTDAKDGEVVPVAFVVPKNASDGILRVEGGKARRRFSELALTYEIPRPAGKPNAITSFYVPADRWTTDLSCALDSLEKVRASQIANMRKRLDALEKQYAEDRATRPHGVLTVIQSISSEDE